ncbi:FeoA family protein [Martelella alba]|uniref:Ferrous iron transport protein A n=1 Tax=Martelella alba TaxID=2590451 RepID=A0ABY2SRB8_9HYPH|nr:FeoA family protein [Martelella alba]TKI06579.1 ferrous iron transport protein A [Martelella alba]
MSDAASRLVSLTRAPLGEKAVVALIRFNGEGRERLAELGLRTGSEIRLIQRDGDGPLLVAVADTRIAVDFAMAGKIMISLIARK